MSDAMQNPRKPYTLSFNPALSMDMPASNSSTSDSRTPPAPDKLLLAQVGMNKEEPRMPQEALTHFLPLLQAALPRNSPPMLQEAVMANVLGSSALPAPLLPAETAKHKNLLAAGMVQLPPIANPLFEAQGKEHALGMRASLLQGNATHLHLQNLLESGLGTLQRNRPGRD